MRCPRASLKGLYGKPGSVSWSFEHFTMRVIATDSTRFRGVRQPQATTGRAARSMSWAAFAPAAPWQATRRRTVVLSKIKALTHGTVDLGVPKSGRRCHGGRRAVLGD